MALKMALRSIGANKMRAGLTMLGIIIGVLALVVLVSLVNSTTDSITSEVSSLGSSLLTVMIKDNHGTPLKLDDLQVWIDEDDAIAAISPYASSNSTGKYGQKNAGFSLTGVTGDYCEINGQKLVQGRYINLADVRNSSRVCVLDETSAKDLIGYIDCVGEEVAFDGVKYKVIGVIEAEDSIASFFSSSLNAYIPYSSLVRLSSSTGTAITTLYAGPAAGYTVAQAEESLKTLLLDRFDDDEDAFRISSVNIIEEAMNKVSSALTVLLGSIAAISLIVGGIGIMNIMLVTVTERTREIGIRKAIGASHRTILVQFLIEAVMLCMMGCALGIFFSWAILQIVSIITIDTSLSFHLQGNVVLWSVIFCFVIGLVFGLYPANKAAKMKPIDALHYGG